MHNELTAEQLRQLVDYDKETGVFTWKNSQSNRAKNGSVAGTRHQYGYIQIKIVGKIRKAHRLAWLYVHGVWPQYTIDHINGIRDDNRISNLRDVTDVQNKSNRTKALKHGRLLGTHQDKRTGKWSAQITVNYVKQHLGMFETERMAHEAYKRARTMTNPYSA